MDPHISISSLLLERKKPDQTLDDIGQRNPKLIAAVLVCSLTWAVGAMQMMTSAFTSAPCENCSMVTLTEEFDLTGEKSYQSEWGTSAFMVGNMLGGATLTHWADRFGRRPILLLCLILQVVAAIGAAFSPSVVVFAICRLFHGATYTGSTMTGWVAGYEHSPSAFRKHTTLIFGLTWVIGYCAVAPMAMWSSSWGHLIVFSAMPILAVILLFICFVPETLHFLVEKRKESKILKWMKQVEPDMVNDVAMLMRDNDKEGEIEDAKKPSILRRCWEHKIFIGYFLIQVYLWTCDNFIYFGLSLYSTQLAGNIYTNYLLLGLVEIPAYILVPIMLEKMGRRMVVSLTHFIAALSFFASILSEGDAWKLICWLMGKLAISCSFMSLFVFASEIFPTEIRNCLVGMCDLLSKSGAIVAPFIGLLGTVSPLLPPLVLSSISAIAGFLTLLLPETKNKPLPSTLSDSL